MPNIIKEFNCVCESSNYKVLYQSKDYKIVRCSECTLVRTMIRTSFKRRYEENYFNEKSYLENKEKFMDRFNQMLDIIEQFKKPGKILDIGCGVGTFLVVARDRGWEVHGIEISHFASGYARKSLKLNVVTGDIFSSRLDQKKFDVIIMNHVLEHLQNPDKVVSRCKYLLNRGGILVIGVPNFDSLMSKIKKQDWLSLMPDEHIWNFTLKTLISLQDQNNFEIKFTEMANHKYDSYLKNLINLFGLYIGMGEAVLVIGVKR